MIQPLRCKTQLQSHNSEPVSAAFGHSWIRVHFNPETLSIHHSDEKAFRYFLGLASQLPAFLIGELIRKVANASEPLQTHQEGKEDKQDAASYRWALFPTGR